MAMTRGMPRNREDDSEGGGWIRLLLLVAVLAAVGLLAAWWFGWLRGAADPRVVEIRKLRDDLADKYQASGGPNTPAEVTAMMDSMRDLERRIDELPENLREQARGGGRMRSAFTASIDRYFAAPPEQRVAELDRQIDREIMMEKVAEARRGENRGGGAGGGPGGGAGPGGGGAGGGGPGGGGAGPGGPGGQRGGTEEDRNRFRKSILDRTTPAQRARYVEHRRALEERRQQRGLPASSWNR